jgi:hypothetical protein
MAEVSRCEHCEKPAERDELGLCAHCSSVDSVRVLYSRRRGWTPEWEENLRRLARRARARLPLFEGPEPSEENAA